MTPVVAAFRHLARLYSIAVRKHENMRAVGTCDQREDALGDVQEIENEVGECFVLVRRPEGMEARR